MSDTGGVDELASQVSSLRVSRIQGSDHNELASRASPVSTSRVQDLDENELASQVGSRIQSSEKNELASQTSSVRKSRIQGTDEQMATIARLESLLEMAGRHGKQLLQENEDLVKMVENKREDLDKIGDECEILEEAIRIAQEVHEGHKHDFDVTEEVFKKIKNEHAMLEFDVDLNQRMIDRLQRQIASERGRGAFAYAFGGGCCSEKKTIAPSPIDKFRKAANVAFATSSLRTAARHKDVLRKHREAMGIPVDAQSVNESPEERRRRRKKKKRSARSETEFTVSSGFDFDDRDRSTDGRRTNIIF